MAIFFLAVMLPIHALADDDDTRLLLNKIDRSTAVRERSHLVEDTPPGIDPGSLITIGETTYHVENTLEDLGPAIYVSMNLRQWHKVGQFVEKYRSLSGHEEGLVLLAEGMLDRENRDYRAASDKLNAALAAKPDFARARLELARVYFEDHKSQEARDLFDQVSTSGIPDEVRPVIEGFQRALRDRDTWHGSLALGLGYSSNVNQANGKVLVSETCIPVFGCAITRRRMDEPIESSMFTYDLTLNRRYQISGHHNALLRAISYGKLPNEHKDTTATLASTYYDESTSIVYAGYNYMSALNDFSVMPLFEHHYGNRHVRYQAVGLRLDWKHNPRPDTQVGVNAQRKHFRFQGRERQYFDNYDENQFGFYASNVLDAKTMIYGGLNFTRKLFPQAVASSKEYMANLGAYRMFDAGFTINATALFRHIRNDEGSQLMGGRREDDQQIYIVNLGMPRFAFKGITPNLYLKRTVNDSSIDWAYEYRQTEVVLKLEKNF